MREGGRKARTRTASSMYASSVSLRLGIWWLARSSSADGRWEGFWRSNDLTVGGRRWEKGLAQCIASNQ